ncbi:MAG: hypothetical protein ACRDZQ_03265 [Acidimicrobiales bacterium]
MASSWRLALTAAVVELDKNRAATTKMRANSAADFASTAFTR